MFGSQKRIDLAQQSRPICKVANAMIVCWSMLGAKFHTIYHINYQGAATMTKLADKKLHETESYLAGNIESPRAYFEAASAANMVGNTEKATRYLRMALNTHNNQLLNQFDIKETLGEINNA